MSQEIRTGRKFLVMYEVIGPVIDGEMFDGKPVFNRRRNLWWAKPCGMADSLRVMICSDEPLPMVPEEVEVVNPPHRHD